MSTSGLYYPFIHFKDDRWLLHSALYWDRMARIVPPSHFPEQGTALARDSEAVRRLAGEVGYVVNLQPADTTYGVTELFVDLLTAHAPRLRARYDVANAGGWPPDPVTAAYAQLRDPHLAYVNSAKLVPDLAGRLVGERLAMEHNENGVLWLGMHPALAGCYMSAVAEDLAVANGLHPTTDETLDHVAAAGWTVPRLAAALLDDSTLVDGDEGAAPGPADTEERAALALVAIASVVPRQPEALTADAVIAVRRSLAGERARFQDFVADLAAGLPELGPQASPAAVAAHLAAHVETRVAPAVEDLRRAMRSAGVDTVDGVLSTAIAMPPALQSIPVDDPVTFGAAAALSLVPALRAGRRQSQEQYRSSPAAYLLSLERALAPRSLLGRVGARLRRFLTGA